MKDPAILLTSWGHAEYVDWWLLIHLLAGITMSLSLRIFEVPFLYALVIVGFILVVWEIYERIANYHESWANIILDLVIGFFGIWLAYQINLLSTFGANLLLAISVLSVWSGLSLWGWIAWNKKHEIPYAMKHSIGEVVNDTE